MDILSVVVVGFGLSMDALAVSICSGVTIPNVRPRHAVKTAFFFGFFQFAMPLLGFLLASLISSFIGTVDHWLAFALLAFIGGKMIWEAFEKNNAPGKDTGDPTKTGTLLLLAIATSIDALAAGFSLGLLGANVFVSAGVIGAITFVLSFAGVMLGQRLGLLFRKGAEIAGGAVLILLGIKILLEHLLNP